MKTCPVCKRTFPTKQALAAHRVAVHGGRQQGGARGPATGNSSVLTFSRFEYIGSSQAKNIPLQPGSLGARQLDNLAAIFEQYRWDALSFTLKPTVGAQTDGTCFVGYSYESDHYPTDKASIAACSPSDSFPVSRERVLAAPVRQLMHSAWLPTKASSGEGKDATSIAGYLNIKADKPVDLWVRYTVSLSGPTTVARTRDEIYSYNTQERAWTKQEAGSEARVNQIDATEGPLDLDVEIGSDNTSVVDTVIKNLFRVYRGAQELHRMVSNGVTLVHAYASAAAATQLPSLTAATLVHHRQLPFRPTPQFRQLLRDCGIGGSGTESYGSAVRRAPGQHNLEGRAAGQSEDRK